MDVAHKRISAGASVRHYSRMDKIDIYFNWFIPGIKRYRDMHNQGDWVLDARFSYQTSKGKFSLLCNNMFNTFYTIRIGRPDAPRSITVQYLVDF
jgi:outer membrane receptor for ferric coprogen and ferric-rhodotorulic acid